MDEGYFAYKYVALEYCLFLSPAVLLTVCSLYVMQNRHPQQLETGHGKQTKRAARNHISFSDGYNYFGEKKKYKAHNLKYVPCILKYVRPIFCPIKKPCKNNADKKHVFPLPQHIIRLYSSFHAAGRRFSGAYSACRPCAVHTLRTQL